MISLTVLIALVGIISPAFGDVIVYGKNNSVTLSSSESDFGPSLHTSGDYGIVKLLLHSNNSYGCNPFSPEHHWNNDTFSGVAVVLRGPESNPCDFSVKVLNAQAAGFDYVIFVDYSDNDGGLITPDGNGAGVMIASVIVTWAGGQVLSNYGDGTIVKLLPPQLLFLWPSFIVTFIIIVASSIVLFTIFMFIRYRRRALSTPVLPEPPLTLIDISRLPSRLASSADTSESCCVCLCEYEIGSTLITLPCNHFFHKECIQPWLVERCRKCPLCKQDPTELMASKKKPSPPPASSSSPLTSSPSSHAGERTPLLASTDSPA